MYSIHFCPVIIHVAPHGMGSSYAAQQQSDADHYDMLTRGDFLIRFPLPNYNTWVAANTSSSNVEVDHLRHIVKHLLSGAKILQRLLLNA
jgi:hypothetical protein